MKVVLQQKKLFILQQQNGGSGESFSDFKCIALAA